MKTIIFYSWQSDLPNATNRGFIESALEKAIQAIKNQGEITLDLCLDRDTQNTAGTPDIADTIFDKIANAHIFVGDITLIHQRSFIGNLPFVGRRNKTRITPNPNVLIELGYAARHLHWDNIICVFNSSYGLVEDLPFDLRKRRILTYNMASTTQGKANERNKLAKALQDAIHSIVERATILQNLRSEVFLEISLACHTWKNRYMDLSPKHFETPEGFSFDNVWELMKETAWQHNYSDAQWKRFLPLFDNGTNIVLEKLGRVTGTYPEALNPEQKTRLLKTMRNLETQRNFYLAFPKYLAANHDKSFSKDKADRAFSSRFFEMVSILSSLARTVDGLRKAK